MSWKESRAWTGRKSKMYSVDKTYTGKLARVLFRPIGQISLELKEKQREFSPFDIRGIGEMYDVVERLMAAEKPDFKRYDAALRYGLAAGRIATGYAPEFDLHNEEFERWAVLAANAFQISAEAAFALGLPNQAALFLCKSLGVMEENNGRNSKPEKMEDMTASAMSVVDAQKHPRIARRTALGNLRNMVKSSIRDPAFPREEVAKFLFYEMDRFRLRGKAVMPVNGDFVTPLHSRSLHSNSAYQL